MEQRIRGSGMELVMRGWCRKGALTWGWWRLKQLMRGCCWLKLMIRQKS